MSRVYAIILSCAAAIISLDQWTKQLALELFPQEGDTRPWLSWWSFTLVHNPGAAFGMLRGLPDSVRTVFFLFLPIVVLGLLWWFYGRKFEATEALGPVALGLVAGGAIGNLIDRIRHGYVIDFVDWFYHSSGSCLPGFHKFSSDSCHWPIFNVADSAISISMVLFVIHSFLAENAAKKNSLSARTAGK